MSDLHAPRGLAIGKFWPPHNGHHAMVEHLARHCDRMLIVICATQTQVPTGLERSLWMQQIHPTAEVIVVDDFCSWHFPEPCPAECSQKWAARIHALGVGPVDLVVTSESYGDRFAELLGARHVSFDPGRTLHDLSGTGVRSSLAKHWFDLHPVTRAGMHRRVVVLGAESTGTSTLSHDLAEALDLPQTPELGRTVSWALYAVAGSMDEVQWGTSEFWSIVNAQIRTEVLALQTAVDRAPGALGPWLVCDTDTLATVAWWERYLGTPAGPLLELAGSRLADLYIVTSPDGVAFDDSDPTRDGREVRLGMHERFLELVRESGRPYLIATGDRADRVEVSRTALAQYEVNNPRFRQ